jgi:hypothetical protein
VIWLIPHKGKEPRSNLRLLCMGPKVMGEGLDEGVYFFWGIVEGDWGGSEDAGPPPVYAVASLQEGVIEGLAIASLHLKGHLGAVGVSWGENREVGEFGELFSEELMVGLDLGEVGG